MTSSCTARIGACTVRAGLALAAGGLIIQGAGALAQEYPARAVRIVVPFTPGGGNDIMARLIGRKLSDALGQQFVVDNRPGSGSVIGSEIVARAPGDGYTLMVTNNALAVNHTLYPKLPFDTLKDFTPIVLAASTPNVLLVHPSLPAKTTREFVALAKARPGDIVYSSAGAGSTSFLAAELFKLLTHTRMLHVPYKGTAPAMTAVLSGETQSLVAALPATVPYIKAGRLRALGVTSAKRATGMPEIPTLQEGGIKDYEFETWYGMFGPATMPGEVVNRLNASVIRALAAGDVREQLARQGIDPLGSTPAEFDRYFRADVVRLAKVIRASGAKPD
jgi:tripartite-type tricarboxylate transporter receptor subunit TctC